jgi:hypothetical protein
MALASLKIARGDIFHVWGCSKTSAFGTASIDLTCCFALSVFLQKLREAG